MNLRVTYSPRSRRDLEKIRAWIARDSGSLETADRFIRQLLDSADTLETLPERFPAYPYSRRWRMMPVGNYLIFYRVQAEAVWIGHIRHAARKPFGG